MKTAFAATFAILFACHTQAQTATHSCSGYLSPGTNTIAAQFVYPEGSILGGLAWFPVMPEGWLIGRATGDGGPLVSPDKKSILFTAFDLPTPLNFTYTVVIPSGFTTTVLFRAQAEYYLDFQPLASYVWATPNPLVMDSLVKTLQVVSAYGPAAPSVGIHSNLVDTLVNASVPASVYQGPTQYVCTGWSMAGHEPSSGTASAFSMTVTNHAVLTWNWSYFNTAPVITGQVGMVGLRTKVSTIPDDRLLAVATDADVGDTLTLVSVQTNTVSGATVVWSGGTIGYLAPTTNRLGLTDLITYVVKDSKGAEATGTLKVQTRPVGVMIRVF